MQGDGGEQVTLVAGGQPIRPSSAPPRRGKRPRPKQQSIPQHGGQVPAQKEPAHHCEGGGGVDDASSDGGSRDLKGFVELEGRFSYDEYHTADEQEWVLVPWYGTNSTDSIIPDEPPEAGWTSPLPPVSDSMEHAAALGVRATRGHADDADEEENRDADLKDTAAYTRLAAAAASERMSKSGESGSHTRVVIPRGGARNEHCDDGYSESVVPSQVDEIFRAGSAYDEVHESVGDIADVTQSASTTDHLPRYNWDPNRVPQRSALASVSRIATGTRAEKIKARNARRRELSKKVRDTFGSRTAIHRGRLAF